MIPLPLTAAGNRTYYMNKEHFTRKLFSRNTKIRLHATVIKPTVTCANKTWIIKKKIEQELLIFERKILQKIFGLNKLTDISQRIKNNDKPQILIHRKHIVRDIKCRWTA